jgi:hypothetical protein
MAKDGSQVFYRVVKAPHGHPFSGLYAVEKVYIKNGVIYKSEISHEWDLRILSEAALARLGGSSAFDAYKEDHPELEDHTQPKGIEVPARTAEDFKDLTKNKLTRELKLKDNE